MAQELNIKPNFFDKLLVQLRVIKALMTRELLKDWGRANIGFLWVFVEPLIFISLIMLVRNYLLGSGRGSAASSHNISLVTFLLTGYLTFMLIRRGLNYFSVAAENNSGLLFHVNVKVINLFYSRFFLECISLSFVLVFLNLVFLYFDVMELPHSFFVASLGWFAVCWFFFGFGLIFAYVADHFPIIKRYRIIWLIVLLSASAIFYMISWLPYERQILVLWNPLAHAMELFREGYFGPDVGAIYSATYLFSINAFLTLFGMILARTFKRRLM